MYLFFPHRLIKKKLAVSQEQRSIDMFLHASIHFLSPTVLNSTQHYMKIILMTVCDPFKKLFQMLCDQHQSHLREAI